MYDFVTNIKCKYSYNIIHKLSTFVYVSCGYSTANYTQVCICMYVSSFIFTHSIVSIVIAIQFVNRITLITFAACSVKASKNTVLWPDFHFHK